MTTSKKLSITQLILVLVNTILFVFFIVEARGFLLDVMNNFSLDIMVGTGLGTLFSGIVIFVIGIVQIIYKSKENTSGIYLAAGIVALFILVPFINYIVVVVTIVLNIIGLAKRS